MSMEEVKRDGYLQEKAINTLRAIVHAVEDLNREPHAIDPKVFNEMQGNFRMALHDATKVVAYLNGAIQKQTLSDVDLLLEKGLRGLDEVLFRYGYISEPEHMMKDRERPNFALRVLELSKKSSREARRAIYDECDKFGYDPLVAKIFNLIEGVTQNTKEWSQFQQEVEPILLEHVAGN